MHRHIILGRSSDDTIPRAEEFGCIGGGHVPSYSTSAPHRAKKPNRPTITTSLIVNNQKKKLYIPIYSTYIDTHRKPKKQIKTDNPNYFLNKYWCTTHCFDRKKQSYNVSTTLWNAHRMHSTRLPTKRAHWLQMKWEKIYIYTQMYIVHTLYIYTYTYYIYTRTL